MDTCMSVLVLSSSRCSLLFVFFIPTIITPYIFPYIPPYVLVNIVQHRGEKNVYSLHPTKPVPGHALLAMSCFPPRLAFFVFVSFFSSFIYVSLQISNRFLLVVSFVFLVPSLLLNFDYLSSSINQSSSPCSVCWSCSFYLNSVRYDTTPEAPSLLCIPPPLPYVHMF